MSMFEAFVVSIIGGMLFGHGVFMAWRVEGWEVYGAVVIAIGLGLIIMANIATFKPKERRTK